VVDAVRDEPESGAGGDAGAPFDVPGHLRRARRLADLSQRELAGHLAVSASTVARWEVEGAAISVRALDQVLRLAGLSLCVLDQGGRPVLPVSPDAVRDNAGRRFPAHLDVVPPDQRPANRGLGPRWDRRPARGWYALRTTRDGAAAGDQDRTVEHPTEEHPTEEELAFRRRPSVRHATTRRVPTTTATELPCECLDDCPDHPACPTRCPCQCEPRLGHLVSRLE
jgi:HTH-type transcriptional regulator/antitoxin HipB